MRSIPLVPATASAKAFQESIALKWMDLAAAPGRYNVAKLIEQYGERLAARPADRTRRLPKGAIAEHPRPMQGGVRPRQPMEHLGQNQAGMTKDGRINDELRARFEQMDN